MDLELFYELQYLQKEMAAIEKQLKAINEAKDMRKLKDEHQRLREEHQKGEERLKNNAYQQEVRKNEIRNLEYSMKSCEDVKYSRETDTVKKLESVEKQLEKLEEKKRLAENDIIELMDEADNINNELAETKKRMAFIKKKYLNCKESADKSVKELEEQKSKLEPQVKGLLEKADRQEYESYCRILKAHPDPVALVENRLCGGCNMEVPAMDFEAVKSGSSELKCQSCGRLLYLRRQ